MSYPRVSHVSHQSYPPLPSDGYPPPTPPPRPGFEQGYGGPLPPYPPLVGGPSYQGYFGEDYPPPPPAHIHHSGPNRPFQPYDYDYPSSDNACFSLVRSCLAALCCCWLLDKCCRW